MPSSSLSQNSRRTLFVAAALTAATILLLWQYTYRYGWPHTPLIGDNDNRKPGLGNPLAAPGLGTPTSSSRVMKPTPGVADAPIVVLRQGTYVGATVPVGTVFPISVEVFRGIPYAESTASQNRFRPPVPLPQGSNTFDAAAFGQICPNVYPRQDPPEGENCLNLNLYRRKGLDYTQQKNKKKKKTRLPVIVYVHGGAFNSGAGMERNMGSFMAWSKEPIIGINFNYRVGALGFLPSALTAREGVLNLGLRDQQLLFEWVKENVEEFGGDPDNITIMGLSAGAHSIGHQLMYYAQNSTAPPFAKAILESGGTTARSVYYPTHPRHLIQFRQFLVAAKMEGVPEEEVLEKLRQAPLANVLAASRSLWMQNDGNVTWPFQPTVDGPNDLANSSQTYQTANGTTEKLVPVIPDLPINSWRNGNHLHIPVLTGFSTNEGAVFVPPKANTSAEFRSFFRTLIPTFTDADLDALEELYPDPVTDPASPYKDVPQGKGKQWARLDAAYSHYAYICPVLHTAHFLSVAGESPVYLYQFAATGINGVANHGDEAPVVSHDMGILSRKDTPGLVATADAMHGAFARFVVSPAGDLNAGSAADAKALEWPVFETPFARDAVGSGALAERGGGDEEAPPSPPPPPPPAPEKGRLMVFGQGNDERRGKRSSKKKPGVPAQVDSLSDTYLRACRFWWPRVDQSEGIGRRGDHDLAGQRRSAGKL